MKKIKVYAGFLTNGTTIDSQPYFIREMVDIYKDKIELVYPPHCTRRVFHDFARNAVVENFLASDCDVLWFLDSDITPNKYVFDLLAVHYDKWQVAGACYPVFMSHPTRGSPEVLITVYKKNEITQNLSLDIAPNDGAKFVDGLATGCLFIKRKVFDQIEKPYFEFKFDPITKNMDEGEDLGFMRKISEKGIQVFTDFSFICRHQKNVDLLDVNNYAIQRTNDRVLALHAQMKHQISESIKAAYQRGLDHGKSKPQAALKPTLWVPT